MFTVGLSTPKGPSGAAVALSAEKQERLEALRNERLRIMQAQASLMARPRSVNRSSTGTPFGRPTPPPPSTLASLEEIDRLKSEIRQLKINEELCKEKIRDMETALRSSTDDVDKVRQQLIREKERKEKLEQELEELKVDRFRTEQLEDEVKALKHQVKEERESLARQIETLEMEKEAVRHQYKSEKSQRLILAARVEELEKELSDAGSSSFTKRPTILANETVVSPVSEVKLPGVESRQTIEHSSSSPKSVKRIESFVDPFAAGEDEYVATPMKQVQEQQNQPETSFVDVEQKGSTRKPSADLASIFGATSPKSKRADSNDLWGDQGSSVEGQLQVDDSFGQDVRYGQHDGAQPATSHPMAYGQHAEPVASHQVQDHFSQPASHNAEPTMSQFARQPEMVHPVTSQFSHHPAQSQSHAGHIVSHGENRAPQRYHMDQPQQPLHPAAPSWNATHQGPQQWQGYQQPAHQQAHPVMKQTLPGRPSPGSSPKEAPIVTQPAPPGNHPAFARPQQPSYANQRAANGPFGSSPTAASPAPSFQAPQPIGFSMQNSQMYHQPFQSSPQTNQFSAPVASHQFQQQPAQQPGFPSQAPVQGQFGNQPYQQQPPAQNQLGHPHPMQFRQPSAQGPFRY